MSPVPSALQPDFSLSETSHTLAAVAIALSSCGRPLGYFLIRMPAAQGFSATIQKISSRPETLASIVRSDEGTYCRSAFFASHKFTTGFATPDSIYDLGPSYDAMYTTKGVLDVVCADDTVDIYFSGPSDARHRLRSLFPSPPMKIDANPFGPANYVLTCATEAYGYYGLCERGPLRASGLAQLDENGRIVKGHLGESLHPLDDVVTKSACFASYRGGYSFVSIYDPCYLTHVRFCPLSYYGPLV